MAKKRKSKKSAKKYYSLMKGSKELGVFTGRQPRQAALKAAARSFTDIVLRERGRRNKDKTYTLHKFKGSRKKVAAPKDRPEWLPAQVWKASVRKTASVRVKKL